MNSPSEGPKSGGAIQAIIVGLVLALLAGSSSPWWWNKVSPSSKSASSGSGGSSHLPTHFMGPLEGGTNRQGSDLSAVGIQSNNASECSDLCDRDDNCMAMTFVKHNNANGGICWPKGSVASPAPNQSMVSAVKQHRR